MPRARALVSSLPGNPPTAAETDRHHSTQGSAGAFDDLESGVGDCLSGAVRVGDGDDAVSVAPDDHRWARLGEVKTFVGTDPLTSHIDHGAPGMNECLLAVAVGERRVAAPDLGETRAWFPPPAPHLLGRPLARFADSPVEQKRQYVFGASRVTALSNGLTSLPSPPDATSTSRCTRSGNW